MDKRQHKGQCVIGRVRVRVTSVVIVEAGEAIANPVGEQITQTGIDVRYLAMLVAQLYGWQCQSVGRLGPPLCHFDPD